MCLSFVLSVLSQPSPGHVVEKKAFNTDYEPDSANGNAATVGLRVPLRHPSVCPVSVSAKTKKPASASGGGFGGDSKTGTVTKTKKAGTKAVAPKAKKGRTLAKKGGNDDIIKRCEDLAKRNYLSSDVFPDFNELLVDNLFPVQANNTYCSFIVLIHT